MLVIKQHLPESSRAESGQRPDKVSVHQSSMLSKRMMTRRMLGIKQHLPDSSRAESGQSPTFRFQFSVEQKDDDTMHAGDQAAPARKQQGRVRTVSQCQKSILSTMVIARRMLVIKQHLPESSRAESGQRPHCHPQDLALLACEDCCWKPDCHWAYTQACPAAKDQIPSSTPCDFASLHSRHIT